MKAKTGAAGNGTVQSKDDTAKKTRSKKAVAVPAKAESTLSESKTTSTVEATGTDSSQPGQPESFTARPVGAKSPASRTASAKVSETKVVNTKASDSSAKSTSVSSKKVSEGSKPETANTPLYVSSSVVPTATVTSAETVKPQTVANVANPVSVTNPVSVAAPVLLPKTGEIKDAPRPVLQKTVAPLVSLNQTTSLEKAIDSRSTATAMQSNTAAKTTETGKQPAETPGAVNTKETLIITHDAIALKAWEIWLAEGCPEGMHLQHWLEAEELLSAKR